MDRQESPLLTEMESVKSLMKLTPEERKKEVRRQMYVKLKAMEMERRQRAAFETMEKCKGEERMRHEAKLEEEEERRENEQHRLKKERLRWKKVMMVEEELVKRPRCTLSDLNKEQQRRREEAELCRLSKVGDKASPESLTSDLKAKQQSKKQPLHNNWVGEQKLVSEQLKDNSHPNSSTYLLFAAKPGPKPEENPKDRKPSDTVQWLLVGLKVGYWVDKYRDHREKKDEKRQLEAEEQYARWSAFKTSRASQFSRHDYYTGGSAKSRNSILKSIF